ncbi:MAG: alpha/beta hydrolase [bacterium]|nr:alpha/beta hydrolase [bacterium]
MPRRVPRSAWVLVHGATVNGRDDKRLVHFADSLARCGVACVVPTLPGMAACRLEPTDLDVLEDVIIAASESCGQAVGVLGFSYGASYSLITAARPEVKKRVSRVIAFGAYHDLNSLINENQLEPCTDGMDDQQWNELVYRIMFLIRGYGKKTMLSETEKQEMGYLLQNYCGDVDMERKKEFYFRCLDGLDLSSAFKQSVNSETFAALSPCGQLAGLACPVTLIHQEDDVVVPSIHSGEIHKELQALPNGDQHSLMLSKLLSHVSLSGLRHLHEAPRLMRALAPLLKAAPPGGQPSIKV